MDRCATGGATGGGDGGSGINETARVTCVRLVVRRLQTIHIKGLELKDFRLWVRGQCDAAIDGLDALIRAFLDQAEAGSDIVIRSSTKPSIQLHPTTHSTCHRKSNIEDKR